jgi:hypothetical protein
MHQHQNRKVHLLNKHYVHISPLESICTWCGANCKKAQQATPPDVKNMQLGPDSLDEPLSSRCTQLIFPAERRSTRPRLCVQTNVLCDLCHTIDHSLNAQLMQLWPSSSRKVGGSLSTKVIVSAG